MALISLSKPSSSCSADSTFSGSRGPESDEEEDRGGLEVLFVVKTSVSSSSSASMSSSLSSSSSWSALMSLRSSEVEEAIFARSPTFTFSSASSKSSQSSRSAMDSGCCATGTVRSQATLVRVSIWASPAAKALAMEACLNMESQNWGRESGATDNGDSGLTTARAPSCASAAPRRAGVATALGSAARAAVVRTAIIIRSSREGEEEAKLQHLTMAA
mmetsp:Transcript_84/g.187  ORF Transcript_84/g.187 Transcript_84/m.187 type:complete len:217 (+) Transcript_84:398-1048(+)